MQFPSISSEEMRRNSKWPWNPVAPCPAPLVVGVMSYLGAGVTRQAHAQTYPGRLLADFGPEGSFTGNRSQGEVFPTGTQPTAWTWSGL